MAQSHGQQQAGPGDGAVIRARETTDQLDVDALAVCAEWQHPAGRPKLPGPADEKGLEVMGDWVPFSA